MEGMHSEASKFFSFYFNEHNLTTLLDTEIVHLVQTQKIILEIYAFSWRIHIRSLYRGRSCSRFVNRLKLDVNMSILSSFSQMELYRNIYNFSAYVGRQNMQLKGCND